jgi:hypothetical protein
MVLPLGMAPKVRAVKVDLPQVPRAVPLGLVIEVTRGRIAALAARGNRPGMHPVAELDDCDEAIPDGAVPLLRSGVGVRSKGGKRTPDGRDEADRNAWPRVVERLNDVARQSLKTIDLAPRSLPAPKVAREFVGGRCERLQQLRSRNSRGDVLLDRDAGLLGGIKVLPPHLLAPEDRERRITMSFLKQDPYFINCSYHCYRAFIVSCVEMKTSLEVQMVYVGFIDDQWSA